MTPRYPRRLGRLLTALARHVGTTTPLREAETRRALGLPVREVTDGGGQGCEQDGNADSRVCANRRAPRAGSTPLV